MEKKSNGLGTASLVLGIVAIVFAFLSAVFWLFLLWMDFVFAIPLATLGFIFGLIATIKHRDGKSISGLTLSSIVIVCTILIPIIGSAIVKSSGSSSSTAIALLAPLF